ncbi:hypothetical protein O3G_MSEX014414 [Manduca sexta]|uniref:FAD-binding PCMH-type domain-containing protein n=2 Tax=Manduca sexta TaxID=7130 RepID=A0A921ZUC0_MANSE|nr:hypothetical protein O3G_MSEX014414 [Manduca sexta]KAG6464292.1 hypothetical protein O3G_MSEX014414 [Manduca sexta]
MISMDFGNYHFYKVFEIDDIFKVFKERGIHSYMLVDGNTGKGILENFEYPETLIDISEVQSLKYYKFDQNLILGANMCLEACIALFKKTSKENCDFSYLGQFVPHFEVIAHIPVRNIASLAGNLMYKRAYPHYQSDVFLLFECVGAVVNVRTNDGSIVSLSLPQFLNFDMQGCLLMNIELPPLSEGSHIFNSYKIMPRSQNALAIVNAAFLLRVDSKNKIQDSSIVFGNIAPDFVHAKETEVYLKNKNLFSTATLQEALRILSSELEPEENPPEPSPAARKKLALGLFYKFVLNAAPTSVVPPTYRSGGELLTRPVSQGKQDYQTDPSLYPLNEPVQKLEALIQSSGEALYANDIPPQPNEVFGAFVLSTTHCGEVDKVHTDEILEIEGVIAVITANDIPGKNSFILPGLQLEVEDEEVLATKVKYYGEPVAVVVANSEELAHSVAKKVRVTYKNVKNTKPVITIDEAKKDSSRYANGEGRVTPTSRGDNVTNIIKGRYEIAGQYHYYMEPMSCVAKPVDQVLEVYDSTQWMDLTQNAIARCLGIQENKVLVKVSRIGGGFGGKISRNGRVAAACGLVAYNLNRPCRFILPMQTNITIAGGRIPTLCEYEVGVDDNGKIQYLETTLVQDSGCSNNDNVTTYTSSSFANCYDPSTFSVKTATVLTDLASNTFARAPGTCEAIASVEHIMSHIAFTLQKDPLEVRKINMRADDNDLPDMIDTLKQSSNYEERLAEVKRFNESNRWMKKAININVMSFPVIYYGNFSVYISIYRGDGTVTISTGGVEMGQGANTKVAQVCARQLGIPLKYVHVISCHSFVASNNVFSGSSITTESVCYSTIKACDILMERLAPIRARMGNVSWPSITMAAGDELIDLTCSYMMKDSERGLEGYSAFAVSCIETQLDVLTGKFQLVRVDILEDCGLSVNPAVDIGQVEGAFVQGVGYFTCEKLVYDKNNGKLLTNRSLTYHVPLCLDIPVTYNVSLRHNSRNSKGVLGAKTCGEMGICTAHGVTLALRDCIMASRKESGHDPTKWINIAIPYDTESILEALDTNIEEFVLAN